MGSAVLQQLRRHPGTRGRNIVCLVHRHALAVPNVETVSGDICAPDLGVSRRLYQRLQAECSAIVHAAGITSYAMSSETIASVNVDGTRNVISLAQRSGANLYHLSSAMLQVFRGDASADNGAAHLGVIDAAPYARSKAQAEALVRESGVPATLVRPALIVGDSRTGEIRRFQGVHMLARFLLEDSIPVLPISVDARFDFLPQDVIGEAVAMLVASGRDHGVVWTTAGERALTVEEVLDVTMSYGAEIGKTIQFPRIVPSDVVDRLIRPVFLEHFPERDQRRFEDMLALVRPLITTTPLPSSLPELEKQGLGTDYELPAALLQSLRYWGGKKRMAERVR